jgi:hypothetical protein
MRQRDLARRAMKDEHAERHLEALNGTAHVRHAQAMQFGSLREAAVIGNGLEYFECFQAIHDGLNSYAMGIGCHMDI